MRISHCLRNLIVILFLWLNVSIASALPSLGTGRMIDGSGQFSTTTTTFTGGAALNGVDHQANITVNSNAVVNLQGSIQVAPADVGKQADLLVVVGVEPNEPFDGGVDTVYRTIDEFGERSTVDLYNAPTVWLNQLADHPFKRSMTLTSEISVDIGTLIPETVKNVSYIFIGYRLADGSIIYSSTPIIVTNIPPNSATSSFAPIQISHVTSPNTELGLIVTNGKESMGIFGKKDSQGRLITINRLSLTSLTDSKSVVITLDANHLPRTMETSDGYKAQFSNYSSNGATGTIQRPDGIIENQSFLSIPYNDIMKAVDTIQQYESSPQPTENSDVPSSSSTGSSTNSDCKKNVGELCRQVENLVWGVSQILSIVSCGAATASAVASGGIAVPLAIWACGSVVLNGIAKLEEPIKKGSCDGGSTETCPIGGEGSCLQHLNNANSTLLDVQACVAPPSVSGCAQAVGLRLADGAVKGLLDPEKMCKQTPSTSCKQPKSLPFKNWCNGLSTSDYFDKTIYFSGFKHFDTVPMSACSQACRTIGNWEVKFDDFKQGCESFSGVIDIVMGTYYCWLDNN